MLGNIEIGVFIFLLIILLVYLVIESSRKKELIVKSNKQISTDKSVSLGSCLVLPVMYCNELKHSDFNRDIFVANLKPGLPILSPFDGVVIIGTPPMKAGSHYIGKVFYIIVSEKYQEKDITKKRRSILIAHTGVEEKGIKNGSLVKKGDTIARTGETNIDINEMFKPYTLVVYQRNNNKKNTKIKEMFGISQSK
jgi:hypothetical protein